MVRPATVVGFSVIVLLCGCAGKAGPNRGGEPGALLADSPAGEHFGPLGQLRTTVNGQTYVLEVPYWHQDRRVLILGAAEYPGHPLGSVFFIMIRLPPMGTYTMDTGTSASGQGATGQSGFHARTMGGPVLDYQLRHGSHEEVFRIGDTTYRLSRGRVFVVDQSHSPPTLIQRKADIAKLFDKPYHQPTKQDFTRAVDRLAADPNVAGHVTDEA